MKKFLALSLSAVLALGALAGCSQQTSEAIPTPDQTSSEVTAPATLSGTVSTDGSTSMNNVISALGEAFQEANNGVTVTYNPTGSGAGIQAVTEGRCDIGLSSRALKDEEAANGLVGTTVALDGIAVIVNPGNPVADLDVETIAKIYTGEITNWSEVGGNDGEIVLIGREAGSGSPLSPRIQTPSATPPSLRSPIPSRR